MLVAGHKLIQVAGRNPVKSAALANLLQTSFTTDFAQLSKSADLYFIAISDDVLINASSFLQLGDGITVHSAGSVEMSVLKGISTRYGILYPLQSLRSDVTELPEIPLLVDGNSEETRKIIRDFAATISNKVQTADDAYRRKIHLAAVCTNNFSNHLFALSADYCKRERVDFSLLLPLLKETVSRLEQYAAEDMQTGPAKRGDLRTIENHFTMLDKDPQLKKIYALMTESIKARYQ